MADPFISRKPFIPPTDEDRVMITGRTGTGKTLLAKSMLARRSFDTMPWIVVDYKREKAFRSMPFTGSMEPSDPPPERPGLYHCLAYPEDGSIDALLYRVWERGKIGLLFDEAYGIGSGSKPLRLVLTQGRALNIPVISCSQRPRWISPFFLSECDYIVTFPLTREEDRKLMASTMDIPRDFHRQLREYHSIIHTIPKGMTHALGPAKIADTDAIIAARLPQYGNMKAV